MDLREQLTEYIEKSDITQSAISRALGINQGRLNQWLLGKYTGSNEKIEEAVKSFLALQEERAAQKAQEIIFCPTKNAKKTFELARFCHLMRKIGVLYGDAGLGKTIAINEYAKQNPDVILFEANLSFSTKITIAELHQATGLTGIGSIHQMFEDIVERLKGTGRLIIIDQAEYLPYRALELLRSIYDKAGIGILLVGMPRLISNLKGMHGQFKQLYSRIIMAGKLERMTEDDVKLILQNNIQEYDQDTLKNCVDLSKGNGRVLSNILEVSKHISKINKRKLDSEIILQTARLLIV